MAQAVCHGATGAASMRSVMLRATRVMSLRLWAGALLVCALVLCVTGVARSAAAMSGSTMMSMPQLGQTDPAVGQESAATTAKAVGSGGVCPTNSDRCARPQAAAAPATPAAPASAAHAADGPEAASAPQAWGRWSGVPPSDESACGLPDLHRLCVSRT